MSRLYGGIHFKDDNTAGQLIGNAAGQLAYAKAQTLFNGSSDD
jgi:membrane-associated phospholipid phosphatase